MDVTNNEIILEMKDISKAFPGVQALDKVSLKVRKGTVHVLVGENGAGKSTLMKVLSGVYPIDSGEITFLGKSLQHQDIKDTLSLGIAMIHQELSPVLDMTIGENIFLGREPTRKFKSLVDFKSIYKQTSELLEKMSLPINPRTKMRQLSVASMQLVEITKAISRGAKLIIMDEPTSAISDTEVDLLFSKIFELKKSGVAMVYITHKMDEIFRIADEVTIIRDGKWIESGPASAYTKEKIITGMVGRTIDNIFPKETAEIGEPILEVRNLTIEGSFENISFNVRRGEILGLSGLVGAGRTEVVRAIFGLDKLDSGEILIDGKPVTIRNSGDAIKHGIGMVSEDRKAIGLVLCRSVRENLVLAHLDKFSKGPMLKPSRETQTVQDFIDLLRVKTASMNTIVTYLSGGNQQKVVIAKWLLGEPRVLILDEPTRGIDVGAKSEIHKIMSDLAKEGLAIIMISSELPEILGMSDRVVVMQQGTKRGELDRKDLTQETIMRLAI